jgi:taurine dioxygenase
MADKPIAKQPVTSAIGAVLSGLDLRKPLLAKQISQVRSALLEHGVIFFRDQHITEQDLDVFVRQFGTPAVYDYSDAPPPAGSPRGITTGNLAPTRKSTAVWHADITWLREPPFATALRAVKVPPFGGDTCWASMYAAYDALSAPFRAMLDGLTAVHSGYPTLARDPLLCRGESPTFQQENVHPVVRVHPETGRKALYVSECTTIRIVELSAAESARVLDVLFAHIRLPDFMVRWHWTSGDLALWDNRSVQHYAVPDYSDERVMQRVELAGDAPVGPSGAEAQREREPQLA